MDDDDHYDKLHYYTTITISAQGNRKTLQSNPPRGKGRQRDKKDTDTLNSKCIYIHTNIARLTGSGKLSPHIR